VTAIPPLPVQPLGYDIATPPHSPRGILKGLGFLLLLFGALQTLAHAAQLALWLLHLADPYYWETRKAGASFSGLPSSYLLTAIGVTEFLSGVAAVVAGLACLTRRHWARPTTLTYAAAHIASRLLVSVTWLSPVFAVGGAMGMNYLANTISQIAWLVASIGLPAIVLMLALRRQLWQTP
jgi:hypothetical protein